MEGGEASLEKHLEHASKHMPGYDDAMKGKITECVETGKLLIEMWGCSRNWL